MVDFSLLVTSLNSLKTATEIAKFIRESDVSLEKAEFKSKLADLIEALADARINMAEIRELLSEKEKQIADLKDALELKENLIRHFDAYYITDRAGNPIGSPFCSHCWEANYKAIHLHTTSGNIHERVCPACNNYFSSRKAPEIQTEAS